LGLIADNTIMDSTPHIIHDDVHQSIS